MDRKPNVLCQQHFPLPGCPSSRVRWRAAARCSTSWRPMNTTTMLCTEMCAPFASGPSPRDTCWTPTSWSGMTPCSRSWLRGRTWWVRQSSQGLGLKLPAWVGQSSQLSMSGARPGAPSPPLAPSPVPFQVWGEGAGGQDGGDTISASVSVLGGRLHREVQDQQRQEGSPGEMPPLPCRLPL